MKCENCKRNSERSICESCWTFALNQLRKFPSRYEELEDELFPSQGYGERVSGSKTPPLPVKLETLHLRTGGISQPLMKHEARIRFQRQETRITFRGEEIKRITLTCEYHLSHSDWTYDEYPDLAELATEIIGVSGKINYVLGYKSEDVVIGSCPTVDENGKPCATKLKVNPQKLDKTLEVTCRACGTTWDSTKWRLLGKMLSVQD